MAEILNYELKEDGVITPVTLTASDTAKVNLTSLSTLIVDNATGGALTVNVKGDTATSVYCSGIGLIDVSAGKDFAVDDGETFRIPLNSKYKEWLGDGNLTVSGATGCTAYILTV